MYSIIAIKTETKVEKIDRLNVVFVNKANFKVDCLGENIDLEINTIFVGVVIIDFWVVNAKIDSKIRVLNVVKELKTLKDGEKNILHHYFHRVADVEIIILI